MVENTFGNFEGAVKPPFDIAWFKKMKFEYASIMVPLERGLQTAFVAFMNTLMIFGGPIALVVLYYVFFCTSYWPMTLFYFAWLLVIDRKTPETGGRRWEWLRTGRLWKLYVDYFPFKMVLASNFHLDARKNYLFACFPHGVLPNGPMLTFSTKYSGYHEAFPDHRPYLLTLKQNFLIPLVRDIGIALGWCSVSGESLSHLLGRPEGGNVVAVLVGGAEEVIHMRNGEYNLFVSKRKGFVKMALKYGTPIVPMITFGENELYTILEASETSLIKRFQRGLKSITGITLPSVMGRGIFQDSVGYLPHRIPIYAVIGEPLDVQQSLNEPSQQQIDELHEQFVLRLKQLFEDNKAKYLKNGDQVQLNIL